MANMEERLRLIGQSVTAQAEEEAQKLRDQAGQLRQTALGKAREEVTRELESREREELAELRASATRTVSRKENTQRRELLLRREEITRQVFDAVKKRLADYTGTPAYTQLLEETAKKMAADCPETGAVVLLRHEDLPLGKKLAGLFGADAQVAEDESMKLGGIRVMHQASGLFLDESLDSRLEDQKGWFYANSGLSIH